VIFGDIEMKKFLFIVLFTFSCNAVAEWIAYSTRLNGDLFFFDNARIEKNDNTHIYVWTRVRYRTSIMGASSYQSLLRLDCLENSETILQSTFYSDEDWTMPAMATNTKEKPKVGIKTNSPTEQLANILCKE